MNHIWSLWHSITISLVPEDMTGLPLPKALWAYLPLCALPLAAEILMCNTEILGRQVWEIMSGTEHNFSSRERPAPWTTTWAWHPTWALKACEEGNSVERREEKDRRLVQCVCGRIWKSIRDRNNFRNYQNIWMNTVPQGPLRISILQKKCCIFTLLTK